MVTLPGTSFEVPPEVVALGVVTGLLYALLGVGLVLVYKSSRVLNFAHGETGALAAGVLPVLVLRYDVSYWVALAASLAVAAGAGAFTELVVIRRLARASRLIVLVATIGTAQLFFAANAFMPRAEDLGTAVFPTPFRANVNVGSLRLGTPELLILAAAPVVVVALALFFRSTRVGLASRAAADNHDAAQLVGVPVRVVSLTIWVIAGLLAGLSAVLIGPTRPLTTQVALGPALLLRALGAAMVGGLTSIPQVAVGGVLIGVVELLVSWNYPTGGAVEVTLFVMIVGSLLARRGLGQSARGSETTSWSLAGKLRELDPRVARLPRVRALRVGMLAALAVVAALAPLPLDQGERVLLSNAALFAVMGLTLVVLTGFAGQISLGQFALVAVGALVGGRFAQLGYPEWMGMLYATAAGGVVALLVGLPALRLRGVFLAVTTLGLAVASHRWLYRQRWLVHVDAATSSLELPRMGWFGIDFHKELLYYWFCLAVLVVAAILVDRLRRSGVGRAMMAVRDNEPAAAALGVSPRRVKLIAFVLAGMLAAFAGHLYGGLLVRFSDPATFAPELSLTLVAMVILGGVTTVTGAIAGALWVHGVGRLVGPLLPGTASSVIALLVSGPGLLLVLLLAPGGIAGALFRLRDRVLRRLLGPMPDHDVVDQMPERRLALGGSRRDPTTADAKPRSMLEAVDVTVCFGGNVAVNGVSIDVRQGEIVGLVGPNGAGKTTLFDVFSGHQRPDEGRVLLAGQDVTWLRPEQRACRGLGRTFQQARLFEGMKLVDVFKVALERSERAEVVPSLLGLPPARHSERRKDLRAEEIVDLLGLRRFAYVPVGELSTGVRRLTELGALVALDAEVLLLDEPTAGIAQRDVEAFRPVLLEIRDHLSATLVVIEHDIPMITDLVDRLYVLAAGEVIAEGPPRLLRDDPRVVEAYLGDDERVIQRSGALSVSRER